jgi:hypothetical protein
MCLLSLNTLKTTNNILNNGTKHKTWGQLVESGPASVGGTIAAKFYDVFHNWIPIVI